MKILLVEDNSQFAEDLCSRLHSIEGVAVDLVTSRDDAHENLTNDFYDLCILDLSIPTQHRGTDVAKEHGQSVFYKARESAPGTPIWILTGSEPDHFTAGLVEYGESVDIWGTRKPLASIRYCPKERADVLVDAVRLDAKEVAVTNAISIETYGKELDLCAEQKRVLKVFTRQNGGESCLLHSISGGLSGARVLKIAVRDSRGHDRVVAIAKIGEVSKIREEDDAYEHVKLLSMQSFTPQMSKFDRGIKNHGAIFYSIADGYDRTLFDVVLGNSNTGAQVINALREGMKRWAQARHIVKVPLREVRRRLLNDDQVKEIQKTSEIPYLDDVENRVVSIYAGCVHGDLHCGNVLVSQKNVPVLIDYGDVGAGFTCIDPVTLEMSLLFHPESQRLGLSQKLVPLITQWPNIDQYLVGNEIAETIRACRDWAHEESGSDAAVLAAGYTYALRQLKYDQMDKKVTLNLLAEISKKILSPG